MSTTTLDHFVLFAECCYYLALAALVALLCCVLWRIATYLNRCHRHRTNPVPSDRSRHEPDPNRPRARATAAAFRTIVEGDPELRAAGRWGREHINRHRSLRRRIRRSIPIPTGRRVR